MFGLFPLKTKKITITITKVLQNVLDQPNRKPNEIWVDKESEFYNRSIKSCLQDNNRRIYSTHNKGVFVITERMIRTLNNKIYKYMNLVPKNVFIDTLDDIFDKYNNIQNNQNEAY